MGAGRSRKDSLGRDIKDRLLEKISEGEWTG